MERSPCDGIRAPTVERARDRVLADRELARQLGGPYGAIVEVLALTGQRRAGYLGFVRDLAEIADGIGIDVTTGGDRTVDPHATAFTRLVFAVERLRPRRAIGLAGCLRETDRSGD